MHSKMFVWSVICMGHCQYFEATATALFLLQLHEFPHLPKALVYFISIYFSENHIILVAFETENLLFSILEVANYNDLNWISWIIVEIGFVAISVTDFVLMFPSDIHWKYKKLRVLRYFRRPKKRRASCGRHRTMSNDFGHSLCVGFEQSPLLSNLN